MFLMPLLLAGAALALIPVVVHLMHRQKTTPVPWAAMQFLLETPVRMRAKKWIDNWLLMLVRMALLLLLALLLARPILHTGSPRSNVPVDVAIVVDHSLSMGRRANSADAAGQTLFEHALPAIEKLRTLLPDSSAIAIILAEHRPRVLTPVPVRDGAELDRTLTALRQVKPGLTDASIPEAVQTAREVVNRGRNAQKLILILSDHQRSNWSVDNLGPWRQALGDRAAGPDKDLPVYTLELPAAPSAANITLGGITLQPGLLGLNRPAQVSVSVSNVGRAEVPDVPVTLTVDGKTAGTLRVQNLAAGQSQTLTFAYMFTSPGSHWLRAKADVVDALEADNATVAAVHVMPQLPVLIVDGALSPPLTSSRFLEFAMQPVVDSSQASGTLIQPRIISIADIASVRLADFPVVVLNDVPRVPDDFLAALSDHVLAGNGAWIILGPRSNRTFLNNTLAKTSLFPTPVKDRINADASPAALDIRAPENPALALLTQAQRNAFAGTSLTQWWRLDPLSAEQTVLLAANGGGAVDGGEPIAVEHAVGSSGGRVMIWTTPADGSGGTLPRVFNFVPLVNETVFHLASSLNKTNARQLTAGDRLTWTADASSSARSVRVLRPDGVEHAGLSPKLLGDTFVFTDDDTSVPGLYELRFDPPTIPQPVFYSATINRDELLPASLSPEDIDALKHQKFLTGQLTPENLSAAFTLSTAGTDVWRWPALLVLAFLTLETYLAWRAMQLQSGTDARDLLRHAA